MNIKAWLGRLPLRRLAVQLPVPQEVHIRLFNQLGEEVFAHTSGALERVFHFGPGLPNGVYLLRVQAGEATFNERVVVQR